MVMLHWDLALAVETVVHEAICKRNILPVYLQPTSFFILILMIYCAVEVHYATYCTRGVVESIISLKGEFSKLSAFTCIKLSWKTMFCRKSQL